MICCLLHIIPRVYFCIILLPAASRLAPNYDQFLGTLNPLNVETLRKYLMDKIDLPDKLAIFHYFLDRTLNTVL